MFSVPSVRNQKQARRHKIHMNTLLDEIKFKNSIEGIDMDKKITGSIYEKLMKEKKSREKEKIERFTIESHNSIKSIESKEQPQKTRASLKLEEIVKYAEKFPSLKNRRIFDHKRSIKFRNSNVGRLTQTSRLKKRRTGFIYKNEKQHHSQPKINYDLLLNFQMNNEILQHQCHEQEETNPIKQEYKRERIKFLIDLYREKNKKEDNYSMKRFIEDGIEKESKRAKKKPGKSLFHAKQEIKIKTQYEDVKQIDLRDQNIHQVHKFIRGGQPLEKEEFSDYISMVDIQKNIQHFQSFKSIYKKIKRNLTKEKINPKILENRSMRNAIYLAENLKQQANMDRKRQIKVAMKRLKITQ